MRSIGSPELIIGTVGMVGLILLIALAFLPSVVGWSKRDRLGIIVLNLVAFPLLLVVYLAVSCTIFRVLEALVEP